MTASAVPLAALPALEAAAGSGAWCPFSTGALSRVTIDGVVRLRPTSSWMPSCEAVFKVTPALGRFWSDDPQWHRTAVISHRLWQEAFGGSPLVVGRTLHMDDIQLTIAGVAPREFMGIGVEIQPEVFTALTFRTGQTVANGRPVVFRQLIGRGAHLSGAALSTALTSRLSELVTTDGFGMSASQKATIVRSAATVDQSGRGLSYLRTQYAEEIRGVALIGVLLLVMTLVIVNGVISALIRVRGREFVIRECLGATHANNASLVLRELAAPVVAGLLIAVPLSLVLARALSLLAWASPTVNSFRPGFRTVTIVGFVAMGVLVLAVAVCAALFRLKAQAPVALMPGRAWSGGATRGWRSGVVSSLQAAMAVGVLFASTQVVNAVWSLQERDLGYDRAGLVYGRLLPLTPAPISDLHAHYASLTTRLLETPGIADVTVAAGFPNRSRSSVRLDPTRPQIPTVTDTVGENFFSTVGIDLHAGRLFVEGDRGGTPVVIVSRDFADRHFGTEPAVGRRVWLGDPEAPHEIVGVVAATRAVGRGAGEPVLYRSWRQYPQPNPMVIVRAASGAGSAVEAISQAVHAQGRDYIAGLSDVESDLRRALAPELTLRAMSLSVAGLGMLLVAVGFFCQQTMWASGEWASTVVRVALGESRRSVFARVLRHSAAVSGAGALLGVPLALMAGAAVQHVLPELGGSSPGLLTVVVIAVVALAVVCATVPTRALVSVRPSDVQRLN